MTNYESGRRTVQLRSIIGALALMALFLSIGCDPPLPGSSLPQGNEVGPVQTHLAPNAKASLPTSGEVLVVGGVSGSNKSTAKAEFFNPATLKWTKTGSMATPRAGETAVIVTTGSRIPSCSSQEGSTASRGWPNWFSILRGSL